MLRYGLNKTTHKHKLLGKVKMEMKLAEIYIAFKQMGVASSNLKSNLFIQHLQKLHVLF